MLSAKDSAAWWVVCNGVPPVTTLRLRPGLRMEVLPSLHAFEGAFPETGWLSRGCLVQGRAGWALIDPVIVGKGEHGAPASEGD